MKNRPLKLTVAGDRAREMALDAINNLIQSISQIGYRVEIDEVTGKWVIDRFLLKVVSITLFGKSGDLVRYRFSLDKMILKNTPNRAYKFYDCGGQCWGTSHEILDFLGG